MLVEHNISSLYVRLFSLRVWGKVTVKLIKCLDAFIYMVYFVMLWSSFGDSS